MSSSVVVSYVHVLLLSSVTSCTIFNFLFTLSVEFCQSIESSSHPVKCYLVKCPCELHHVSILFPYSFFLLQSFASHFSFVVSQCELIQNVQYVYLDIVKWFTYYPEHVLTWEGYGNWRVSSCVCLSVFVTFNS